MHGNIPVHFTVMLDDSLRLSLAAMQKKFIVRLGVKDVHSTNSLWVFESLKGSL